MGRAACQHVRDRLAASPRGAVAAGDSIEATHARIDALHDEATAAGDTLTVLACRSALECFDGDPDAQCANGLEGCPWLQAPRPSGRAPESGWEPGDAYTLPSGWEWSDITRLRAAQDARLPDLVPIRVGGAVAWVTFHPRDPARWRRGRQRIALARLGRAAGRVLRTSPARGDVAGAGEVRAGGPRPVSLPRGEQPGCNRVRGHDTSGPDGGHGRIVPFVEDSGIDAA
ncbi:MAG: hypothetical protein OXG35_32480 [Acidobacteria bacterium]|nr:hypothetical protein [Acidobacteriota bacterium]